MTNQTFSEIVNERCDSGTLDTLKPRYLTYLALLFEHKRTRGTGGDTVTVTVWRQVKKNRIERKDPSLGKFVCLSDEPPSSFSEVTGKEMVFERSPAWHKLWAVYTMYHHSRPDATKAIGELLNRYPREEGISAAVVNRKRYLGVLESAINLVCDEIQSISNEATVPVAWGASERVGQTAEALREVCGKLRSLYPHAVGKLLDNSEVYGACLAAPDHPAGRAGAPTERMVDRMSSRSAALRELALQASSLAKQCPKVDIEPGTSCFVESEKGKEFCQRVARWMEDVLRDKELGKIARDRMNWPLRGMQNGEAGRLYRELYGLLCEGNDLIEERAPRVSIAPEWRIINDSREMHPPKFESVDAYAKARRAKVADALADPFAQLIYVNQEAVCDATIEPFSKRLMTKLDEAQLTLKMALLSMQGAGAVDFDEIRPYVVLDPTATGSDRTEWQRLRQDLERVRVSPAATEAAPWVWLAVNVCCFSVPPRFDVFDEVPEMRHKSLWAVATSGGGGPIPRFVYVVRDALKLAGETSLATPPRRPAATAEPAEATAEGTQHNGALLSPRELARHFSVPDTRYDALNKRLQRWRSKNFEGWQEVSEPRPREAHYVYQIGAVRGLIEDFLSR